MIINTAMLSDLCADKFKESVLVMLIYLETVSIPYRLDEKESFLKSEEGSNYTNYKNALIRHYDNCDDEVKSRIENVCDIESYNEFIEEK